jgi:beta-lactamase regulating signal transducer with metallopeptidase domain
MMLSWMLSAMLFTAFLAVAAWFAERALRIAGRPARGAWLFTLTAGAMWPVLVPLLRSLRPGHEPGTAGVALLDAITIGPERVASAGAWAPMLDRILVGAWVGVSLVLVLRYLLVWRAVRALRHSAECREVDGVEVLVSGDLGPAVLGVRDTAVLVPRAILELDAPLRALVLRHEEEHRKARDTWLLLALAVAVAAMPWNLPLWWIARRARLALEVDCDARVLAAGGSATRYVQVLLLAAQRTSVAPLTPMLVASRTHLERRIVAMQNRTTEDGRGGSRTLRITAATAACVAALAVAGVSPIAGQTPTPRPADTTNAPRSVQPAHSYFEFQVEQPVRFAPGSPHPRYPDALRAADVKGTVLAQFVVDTSGRAEPSTFKVLKTDRQEFTDAVKAGLPDMRFIPAEVGGRKVKQLVQQPFTFAPDNRNVAQPVQIPNPKRP